ncbi:MAG: transcription termination factor Rho [Puniceicoccales bacterium]|jgi:transcription termination factor Rho|nr:transcription termination factor Rho [Puniceicoccales bacterium]
MDTELTNDSNYEVKKNRRHSSAKSTKHGQNISPMAKPASSNGEDDYVPERFSTDFEDGNESESSHDANNYNAFDVVWSPKHSNAAIEDDLSPGPMDNSERRNGEGRRFSTQIEEQPSSNAMRMSPQKQQNRRNGNDRARNNENRSQNNGGRSGRDSGKNNHGNNGQNFKHQQNNGQNRQRFARTVKIGQLSSGLIKEMGCLSSFDALANFAGENINFDASPFDFNGAYETRASLSIKDVSTYDGVGEEGNKGIHKPFEALMVKKFEEKIPIIARGVLETIEGGDGLLVYANDNYRIRPQSAFIPKFLIQRYGLRRGQDMVAYLHPPAQNSTCPFVLKISNVIGCDPGQVGNLPKFKDLIPFYPTERLFLECAGDTKWDNVSMRIIDILTPIGLGQRGLIVAPPRTGKTVLLQGIANAISKNRPDVKLIILLIDERPEEVTDFRRQVANAEIISSTFDESTDNHVHAADMVIDKARRQVEAGKHVVILLDSITRLARAHNTEQPSSGKLLSGGVDANALQAPKKFFGAARNIEGGGSLTILATALVETGSRMDEVIFEEFKGTGNMELHLDRSLIDRRMFPALNIEKSGTRKEELLYHPEEMEKVYALRRAVKGISPTDAMEMLIQRIRKTKTNTEFLLNVNR